jgi:tRNA(His) 5'-end guanylyltransferase
MGKKQSLGDRIKSSYEDRSKTFLNRRTITIIRLDGKGFSKFTKGLNKPFDDGFSQDMDATALYLCENIQGAKFAYTQSDEISVVLCDFDNIETDAWFDYNVQKMTSIAASLASARFNQLRMARYAFYSGLEPKWMEESYMSVSEIQNFNLAFFDARVFQVPNVDEMFNAILWRQQDCTRNSISMAASAQYSHKELEKKSSSVKQEMLFQKGINWNDYLPKYKRGSVVKKKLYYIEGPDGDTYARSKWIVDANTPIFTEDREYLYNLIPTM